jgi:hypothetical protein
MSLKRKHKNLILLALACTLAAIAVFVPIPSIKIPENAVVWKLVDSSDSHWYPGHAIYWRDIQGKYEQIDYKDAKSQGLTLAPGINGRAEYPPMFFTLWYLVEDQEWPEAQWAATGENIPSAPRVSKRERKTGGVSK